MGSELQGHPYQKMAGFVETSTGSLGQGISVGVGMALGKKIKKETGMVWVLSSDGEQEEGQVWEAAMTAGHHQLDHLCAILDMNKLQQNGPVREIKNAETIVSKWHAFGWHVKEADGHNFNALIAAFDEFGIANKGKPMIIIAHTEKGKGVSFMEGQAKWHGKAPKKEELELALKELGF